MQTGERPRTIWELNPEWDAILRHGHKTGLTTSVVAEMIGTTKGSVIGRSHRLKLGPWPSMAKARAAKSEDRAARKLERARKVARRVIAGLSTEIKSRNAEEIRAKLRSIDRRRAAELPPLRASIVDLEDHECKFPYGDDKSHAFCGRGRHPGMPYCLAHARICFDLPEEVEARPPQVNRSASARVERAGINALRSLESFVCVP